MPVMKVYNATTSQWEDVGAGGLTNPMTTAGDIIYGGASGTPTRLAKGTDGQVLTLASGVPIWADRGSSSGPITSSGLTISTDKRLLGRDNSTAGAQAIEEISLGTGLSLDGSNVLNADYKIISTISSSLATSITLSNINTYMATLLSKGIYISLFVQNMVAGSASLSMVMNNDSTAGNYVLSDNGGSSSTNVFKSGLTQYYSYFLEGWIYSLGDNWNYCFLGNYLYTTGRTSNSLSVHKAGDGTTPFSSLQIVSSISNSCNFRGYIAGVRI